MSAPPIDRHFALRKLHSLLGVVPIGAFLAFHLFENSLAAPLHGLSPAQWTEDVVMKIDRLPYIIAAEVLLIALPILFHGIYGVIIWLEGRNNTGRYGYFRNWMYLLQRVSGAIAFAFILTHVWQTRVQVLLGHLTKEQLYERMAAIFSSPAQQAWYAVGMLAAIAHFVNGLWLVGITWGLTTAPRAQRIATGVWTCAGVVLLLLGGLALFGFQAPTIPGSHLALR